MNGFRKSFKDELELEYTIPRSHEPPSTQQKAQSLSRLQQSSASMQGEYPETLQRECTRAAILQIECKVSN